jgi:hypothetical protein
VVGGDKKFKPPKISLICCMRPCKDHCTFGLLPPKGEGKVFELVLGRWVVLL